jgi:NADH:ubiquinone oxidoreductase subunit F (NADH-binding)/(2Fe-2S) ferredoxin/NAD-dependent dihydropyrimidine dehydrogenase PreA subunit
VAGFQSHLMLCAGTGCVSNGAFEVKKALEQEIAKHGLENEIAVVITGCNGFCAQGPILVVQPEGIFYQRLDVKNVPKLIEEHFVKGNPVKELMYTPPGGEEPIPLMSDIDFFKKQVNIALRNRGLINPERIDDYIARDGYKALSKVLSSLTPESVVGEVKSSGLRGRGGAGFPTGLKWEKTRAAQGDVKYVVCNADEGDPGAFMDRSIIESDPHSVLEGMAIGAYAIGAKKGFVYIRAEYPLAVQRLLIAIDQARERGMLGERIFATDFSFDIHVQRGAGAFVCGEETGLIASIEGKRGMPRSRPPYPAEKGLWGRPTNINNVETWATVPVIILRGAEWFSGIGTEGSKGTKVFSLVGKINNIGLVEVPMGITLREIIYDIGGGIPDGKKFKAVQTGGPSGGCIPAELIDLPIDYESLTEAGSMMGSGGMVVMDEDTCMVDVARYFLDFTVRESCGKCVPCRVGTRQLVDILERITQGKGEIADLDKLERLGRIVKGAALCGLGNTAPNPVLSTLRYFRDEYIAHVTDHRCPAGVCRELVAYRILSDVCTGCMVCARACPADAITGEKAEPHIIDQDKCIKCRACYQACQFGAVIIEQAAVASTAGPAA